MLITFLLLFFFFNDTATTEIYTLSLHDALPISTRPSTCSPTCSATRRAGGCTARSCRKAWRARDRKSTRLNSSHGYISYAVFCLKKKKKIEKATRKEKNNARPALCNRSMFIAHA